MNLRSQSLVARARDLNPMVTKVVMLLSLLMLGRAVAVAMRTMMKMTSWLMVPRRILLCTNKIIYGSLPFSPPQKNSQVIRFQKLRDFPE